MTYRKNNIDVLENFIYRIFETLASFSYVSRGWINKIYNNYYGRIIIVNDSLQKDITFKFIDIYKDNRSDFINEIQECSVCFDETKHLTPCGHPLCKICEEKLISFLTPFVCPICRRKRFEDSFLIFIFPHKAIKQLFLN